MQCFIYSRTGIVYNVTPSAVGIIINKVVGNRYIEKRVNIRIEHIRHSKCRQEFLDRVKRNHEAHVAAKEKGGKYCQLLVCTQPRSSCVCVRRACQPQASTRPAPRCADDLDEGQRPPDDDACTLRDHYLKRILLYYPCPRRICHEVHAVVVPHVLCMPMHLSRITWKHCTLSSVRFLSDPQGSYWTWALLPTDA